MKILFKIASVLLFALAQSGFAQPAGPRQDPAPLRQAVEDFLRAQTAGLPGEIAIEAGQIDPRLNLPACAAPQAFLPNGARAWGKTSVGIRCAAPFAWTVYVAASVRVVADYLAAAAPLSQGQRIGPGDIVKMKGDLALLPAGVVTDPTLALGRTIVASLAMGAPLRIDMLRSQPVVQQGQTVRLVSNGSGFRVSSEGRALANAGEGQLTQARTPTGQVVSGVARSGGIVEVSY